MKSPQEIYEEQKKRCEALGFTIQEVLTDLGIDGKPKASQLQSIIDRIDDMVDQKAD